MRIRLSINYRADKVLAKILVKIEIIVIMLNKANKISLII